MGNKRTHDPLPYYLRNLYVLSLTIFLAAVSWNQIVPFLPLFLRELGVKGSALAQWSGVIFAVQSIAGIVMQPFWGKLADRFGRKPMVIRAGICLAGIYFGMSICKAPWQLATFRFLNGALTGFIPGSVTLIATNTPRELSGRCVAIAQTASATGGIVGPAIGGVLAGIFGYRQAMQVSGLAVLFSTLLVLLAVTEPNKVTITEKTTLLQDFKIGFGHPILLAVMGTTAIASAVSAAIQPVLALYLQELSSGGAAWLSGVIFSLPGLAFVLSACRWSRFGERTSYYKAMFLGFLGSGVAMGLLAVVVSTWQFSIFYFASGIFLAAISPCAAALIATGVGEEFRGRAYGIQQAAGTMGALIAPLAGGLIGGLLGLRYIFGGVALVSFAGAGMLYHRASMRKAAALPQGAHGTCKSYVTGEHSST